MTSAHAAQLKMWDPIWVRTGSLTREDVVMSTERYENGTILVETRANGWVAPGRVSHRVDEQKPPEETWNDENPEPPSAPSGPASTPGAPVIR
jgi:hypothetical protein